MSFALACAGRVWNQRCATTTCGPSSLWPVACPHRRGRRLRAASTERLYCIAWWRARTQAGSCARQLPGKRWDRDGRGIIEGSSASSDTDAMSASAGGWRCGNSLAERTDSSGALEAGRLSVARSPPHYGGRRAWSLPSGCARLALSFDIEEASEADVRAIQRSSTPQRWICRRASPRTRVVNWVARRRARSMARAAGGYRRPVLLGRVLLFSLWVKGAIEYGVERR